MLAIKLRPAAERDLDDIWDYTATTWSEGQAATYLTGLGDTLARLAEFPEMSRLRTEFTPPVRIHPYEKHLVIYLADSKNLDVLRVVHGRANWMALLAE